MRSSFSILFGTAIITAAIGFGIPWIAYYDERHLSVLAAARIAFAATAIWLVLFVWGLFLYRVRGLWLLAVAPFVLWWTYVFGSMAIGCAITIANCP